MWGYPGCRTGVSSGAHLSSRCDSPCPRLHRAPGAHGHTRGAPEWWPGAGESAHGDPAARCPPGEGGEDVALVTSEAAHLSPTASKRQQSPGPSHKAKEKTDRMSCGQVSGKCLEERQEVTLRKGGPSSLPITRLPRLGSCLQWAACKE